MPPTCWKPPTRLELLEDQGEFRAAVATDGDPAPVYYAARRWAEDSSAAAPLRAAPTPAHWQAALRRAH